MSDSVTLWAVPHQAALENTGVSCHALPQGIFPTQGLNLSLLLLHMQMGSLPLRATWEAP